MTVPQRRSWQPPAGEELVARAPVSFATGAAHRVKGRRWFRDIERRDIQGDLAGWPPGPAYRLRSRVGPAVWTVLTAAFLLGLFVLTVVSGGNGPSGGSTNGGDSLGRSEDPDDEETDFPVLWAAPGTIARTLPWELDPDRRPGTDLTHLILTDRRLLVLGGLRDPREPWEEILGETDLSTIATVERRPFSVGGRDFRITFTDGSWCRLTSLEGEPLVRHLTAGGPPVSP
ncbi:hypothetical protein [Streptomyces shenzhenensis]|uniref:hypothetical protein n=1 Tax=Streptomyces shenzhenensis TaxID=943815 RepID=UPI0015F06ECD|nr:hypothetical protein [Streptomyces shenzhenensis]